MRQIKFKGKRISDGVWLYGDLMHLEKDFKPLIKIIDWSTKDQEVDPDTVSQFTGLTDRNGKEIYENDIVSFPVKHKNLLVEWNDDLCVYQFSDGSLINSGDNYSEIIFIVGDVFDNPERI
ncbi:MAG: YopX family protein [Dysgonomonas sp.]|uniref:YopX family protein n=1 Tax=Dysgonomonas sp. TaxID=1891233 RepID=UPI0039E5BC59